MVAVDSNLGSECISSLIDLGCDPNAQDSDGMTSLHKSIWTEDSDAFELLLSRGANLDLADSEGDTGRKLANDLKQFREIMNNFMTNSQVSKDDNLATSFPLTESQINAENNEWITKKK